MWAAERPFIRSHGGVLAAGRAQVAPAVAEGGAVPLDSQFYSPPLSPSVFSYIRYSQICAQVVRAAMKPQYKAEAERAATATVKTVKAKKE